MHKSAHEIGAKFLERYFATDMHKILEVGAYDVNGPLKDFKRQDCEWIGVDLEAGKGVDVVIERASKLPFEDNSFDVVVATSVFEHDPTFWLTFNEILRVVKQSGFIYICAPSNGWVHRYPMDVYRFYPDAGMGLVEWGRREFPELHLVESFISERDGDVWNDFCAVFSKKNLKHNNKIYTDTPCSNVWSDGQFLENTLIEATEDMRLIDNLNQELGSNQATSELRQKLQESQDVINELQSSKLRIENLLAQSAVDLQKLSLNEVAIRNENLRMKHSLSWRLTKPLRKIKSWIST